MAEQDEVARLRRSVRRLTIAVVALGVVSILAFLMSFSAFLAGRSVRWQALPQIGPSGVSLEDLDLEGFFPKDDLAALLNESSVILHCETEFADGRARSRIKRVLLHRSDTKFDLSAGDLFPFPDDEEEFQGDVTVAHGEGSIVFLRGSPAMPRSVYSIHGGRVFGLGNAPLERILMQIASVNRGKDADQ